MSLFVNTKYLWLFTALFLVITSLIYISFVFVKQESFTGYCPAGNETVCQGHNCPHQLNTNI